MTIEHVHSAVVHTWRCTRCRHEWDIYGGHPFNFDSDEAPRGQEPTICPHCLTEVKTDRRAGGRTP